MGIFLCIRCTGGASTAPAVCVSSLSIFGGFLRVQHPPTAQTHIIPTEDKSVSVKCVAYAHVDHQVYRGLARARPGTCEPCRGKKKQNTERGSKQPPAYAWLASEDAEICPLVCTDSIFAEWKRLLIRRILHIQICRRHHVGF